MRRRLVLHRIAILALLPRYRVLPAGVRSARSPPAHTHRMASPSGSPHLVRSHSSRAARVAITAALACLVLLGGGGAPLAAPASVHTTTAPRSGPSPADSSASEGAWRWPVDGGRHVSAAYRAPAHAYGPGHRGMDVTAAVGTAVGAPADGVVAFQGVVVDRPVLTIRHADGLVSSFEPLESSLRAGDTVSRGQEIGRVSTGGHTAPGALHVGVRRDGEYINPMLLFGAVLRARLLPCCGT